MRYLSLCSGIEAASVAWEPLGWTPVAFAELDSFPSAVLSHRFPSVPNLGDMTRHANWNLEPRTVDLVVGGTPCQSFSVAGLRAGLADPRGNLALTFLAIVDRLRPEWVIFENVPGLLSSNRGRDFGSFLGALAELRYGFAYRVLDARHFGVAQRRRRVFVVANATDWRRAAAVLFEPESLRRNPPKSRAKREGTSSGSRLGSSTSCFWNGEQVTQTLDAVLAKQQAMRDKNRFPAVLVESPPPAPIVLDRAAFNQGENASYPPRIKASETMSSLVARGPHAVATPLVATSEPIAFTYPINTLTLGGRPDPVNDPRMTMGIGDNGDPQFTLQAAHCHAVATSEPIAFHPTQDPISNIGFSHSLGTGSTSGVATCAVTTGLSVRRLTPVECERLQGFPDDWTSVPFRGKPAADGPRYKAIGNSMAVPVVRWIGERIAAIDKVTK